MKRKVIVYFFPCVIFSSFVGQKSVAKRNLADFENAGNPTVAGDTVKELGDKLLHVFQDNKNNYWFGGRDKGLYRYDGKHILLYSTKHGLRDNVIEGIQQDATGNIYIHTMKGISKFDGKQFVTLKAVDNSKAEWKLQANDLWFKGAQDSGVVYRYDGKVLHRLRFPKTKEGEDFIASFPRSEFPAMAFNPYDVYTIYKDKRSVIWFGTGNLGLCRYDGKTFDWLYEDQLTNVEGGGSFGIRSILEDSKGDFWFCNTRYRYTISNSAKEKGIINYKRGAGIKDLETPEGKDHIFYMSLVEDKNGLLWMATYNEGVWCYDRKGKAGQYIKHYTITEKGKAVKLFSIYQDHQGILWLGSHESGVYRFNGKQFEAFKP